MIQRLISILEYNNDNNIRQLIISGIKLDVIHFRGLEGTKQGT